MGFKRNLLLFLLVKEKYKDITTDAKMKRKK